ncbi:hypothetical protein Pcinc_043614 [Petrolisthes cinctipes]|uniref:Uncharacterized protein n=1 Tax=Petrolisthes cinctipes TaxID=88211 RepID=A0AAE1BHC9_PETCI|nr:hypothetical protein Pcinc_043614 [Petrolisthes cinctipes]
MHFLREGGGGGVGVGGRRGRDGRMKEKEEGGCGGWRGVGVVWGGVGVQVCGWGERVGMQSDRQPELRPDPTRAKHFQIPRSRPA